MRGNIIVAISVSAYALLLSACGQTMTSSSYNPPAPPGSSTQVQVGEVTCDNTINRFSGGDGSALAPYRISSLCNLVNFLTGSDTWGSSLVMTTDVDLAGVTLSYSVAFTGT